MTAQPFYPKTAHTSCACISSVCFFFSDSGNQSGESPPAAAVTKKPPPGGDRGDSDGDRDQPKRPKSERKIIINGKPNQQVKGSGFKYGELIVLG